MKRWMAPWVSTSVSSRWLCLRDYSSRPRTKQYDVCIVGAGAAGLTLAASLKSCAITKRLKIALVDSASIDQVRTWQLPATQYSNRVSSLTPRSVKYLKQIQVWDHVDISRVADYNRMTVWDGVSGARIDFDPDILAQNHEIAFMVENLNLRRALVRALDHCDHPVDWYQNTRVETISVGVRGGVAGDDLLRVAMSSHTNAAPPTLCAKLLVGADGANSPVRQFAQIETRGWSYDRLGVVATVKLAFDPYEHTAYQRFLPTGPLALLPLPGGYATMVWSTTRERAQHLQSLAPQQLAALINAGFRLDYADVDYLHGICDGIDYELAWRLQNTPVDETKVPVHVREVHMDSVAAFPLKLQHADSYIGHRVALVGDAAHTTHPLAGQGLNMGQEDVQHLANAIRDGVVRGLSRGSALELEPFWANAYTTNHVKLGVFDKLHKLYSTDSAPVVAVRSLGLASANYFDFVKRFLMSSASN